MAPVPPVTRGRGVPGEIEKMPGPGHSCRLRTGSCRTIMTVERACPAPIPSRAKARKVYAVGDVRAEVRIFQAGARIRHAALRAKASPVVHHSFRAFLSQV